MFSNANEVSHVSGTASDGRSTAEVTESMQNIQRQHMDYHWDEDDFQSMFPVHHPAITTDSSTTSNETTRAPFIAHSGTGVHSSEALSMMGATTSKNTERNMKTALKALCVYVCRFQQALESGFPYDMTSLPDLRDESDVLSRGKRYLFSDKNDNLIPSGHNEWKTEQLERIRFLLIEWVVNYKTREGNEVHQNILKSYIFGVQRGFRSWGYDIDLFGHPVFKCQNNGLVSVLDNKARQLQSTGVRTKSQNVLSRDDLAKLYPSDSLSKDTPKGYQKRMIFSVGLLTGVRSTELHSIETTQFQKINLRGNTMIKYTGIIGSNTGGSKTARGGWGSIGRRPPEVCIYNESYCDSKINLFLDISEYLEIISKFSQDYSFFVQTNPHATSVQNFFKAQNIGKGSFRSVVKTTCTKLNIRGDGDYEYITTHGLRGTLATLLYEERHSDSRVSLRTGHRNPKSLTHYQHLRGGEGQKQQAHLFQPSAKRQKSDEQKLDQAVVTVSSTPSTETAGTTAPVLSVGSSILSAIVSVSETTVNNTVNINKDKRK